MGFHKFTSHILLLERLLVFLQRKFDEQRYQVFAHGLLIPLFMEDEEIVLISLGIIPISVHGRLALKQVSSG